MMMIRMKYILILLPFLRTIHAGQTCEVPDPNSALNEDNHDITGCSTISRPIIFSGLLGLLMQQYYDILGMVGRLCNMVTTYVNMIAFQYKMGYQYFLPLYHSELRLGPDDRESEELIDLRNNIGPIRKD